MLPHPTEYLAQERLQSYLQEAETRRLIKKATRADKQESPISQLQWWMGNQLVNWGSKLRRYHATTITLLF